MNDSRTRRVGVHAPDLLHTAPHPVLAAALPRTCTRSRRQHLSARRLTVGDRGRPAGQAAQRAALRQPTFSGRRRRQPPGRAGAQVLDGDSAPVTAGNFAENVRAGLYDGAPVNASYASVLAGGGRAPGAPGSRP